MIVAITGISGYIGRYLFRHLDKDKRIKRIVGIDIQDFGYHSPKLVFYRRDIRDSSLLHHFRKEGVKTIVHLAFVVNPMHNEREMHDIDVRGTQNILDTAAALQVSQVLLFSSTSAYGAWPDNPIPLTEDHPLRPNPRYRYAMDKVEVEKRCQEFMKQNPDVIFTILRPCVVLGPQVNNFISERLTNNRPMWVVDHLYPEVQYVHEDDVLKATLLALEKRRSGTYNIVGSGMLNRKDVFQLTGKTEQHISSRLGYPLTWLLWKVRSPRVFAPPSSIEYIKYPWVASGAKAEKEIGFTPKFSSRGVLEDLLSKSLSP